MPLDLAKRGEQPGALTAEQHDANLTAIETDVNANTAAITDHGSRLTALEGVTVNDLDWSVVPTSDPAVAGAIWLDGSTLKISAG